MESHFKQLFTSNSWWCLFVYIEITNNLQVATTFNPIWLFFIKVLDNKFIIQNFQASIICNSIITSKRLLLFLYTRSLLGSVFLGVKQLHHNNKINLVQRVQRIFLGKNPLKLPYLRKKNSKLPYLDNMLLEVAKTKWRFKYYFIFLSNLWSNLAHSSWGLLPVHLFSQNQNEKNLASRCC